jgi:hypothetical protein
LRSPSGLGRYYNALSAPVDSLRFRGTTTVRGDLMSGYAVARLEEIDEVATGAARVGRCRDEPASQELVGV